MKTRDSVEFFFQHAGWSYDPKTETELQGRQRAARVLANAERHARQMEWVATWEDDQEPWDAEAPEPRELLVCVLRNSRGDVLASLCGIADPSKEYGRVVEAELAAQAREEITTGVLEAI